MCSKKWMEFPSHLLLLLLLWLHLQVDVSQLMTSVNGSQSLSPIHRPTESPGGGGGGGGVGGPGGAAVEQSPVDRTKGFFPDESEPLLRCDSTSSKDSALSRNGSFITKGEESMKLTAARLLTNPADRGRACAAAAGPHKRHFGLSVLVVFISLSLLLSARTMLEQRVKNFDSLTTSRSLGSLFSRLLPAGAGLTTLI